mmetsp:Transcript_9949/g.36387  ORF Transcript_9949/g.36387 Transcript_9949/m.36387 type:complete len:204 (-) Transcript_9949:615-1226(-)
MSSRLKFQQEMPRTYSLDESTSFSASPAFLRFSSRTWIPFTLSSRGGSFFTKEFRNQSCDFAPLKNLCSSSFEADGLFDGSFWRHIATTSLKYLVNLPLSPSTSNVGGGFCKVMRRTFMGGYLANGACPWASSKHVIPRDHMSARQSYPPTCSMTSGAIQHGVPTNVWRDLLLSPKFTAVTPKSASITLPLSSTKMFPALTSR